jgi:KaiC/GvpD/RAD55 family RecA-like ATPase
MNHSTPLTAAQSFIAHQIRPIPLQAKSKIPSIADWTRFNPIELELPRYFQDGINLGALLGSASNHIVDVDLDWEEAGKLAPMLLPKSWTVGRGGHIRHILIKSIDAKTVSFDAPVSLGQKRRIVEILSDGKQVMMPPSIHPNGQPVEWLTPMDKKTLAEVKPETLLESVQHIAGAAVLLRLWPDLEGSRHDITMALAGSLYHAQWSEKRILEVLKALLSAANDSEKRDRARAILDTIEAAKAGKPVTGLPKLAEYLPADVIECLKKWWGLGEAPMVFMLNGKPFTFGDDDGLVDAAQGPNNGMPNGNVIQWPQPPQGVPGSVSDDISWALAPTLDISKAVLDYPSLLSAEIKERAKILPWMPEGSLCMVFGARGLGKTFFGLSLATAVVQGKPFMKWPIQAPSGVVYVDGEMFLGDVRARLAQFIHQDLAAPLLTLSHEHFFDAFEQDLSISDKAVQDGLLKLLDSHRELKLLVIDNLSSLSRIREDKSDDWRALMLPFLIACRRRGVAVLMVHHAGKGGDQRGTGAREDHLDTSIKLSLPEGADYNDGCYFRADFTKSRGCYGEDIAPFTAKLIPTPTGFDWSMASIEESDKDRLIHLITEYGAEGITAKEAAEELGIKKQYVSRYRKQLEDEGIIQFSTDRKKPMVRVFREEI